MSFEEVLPDMSVDVFIGNFLPPINFALTTKQKLLLEILLGFD